MLLYDAQARNNLSNIIASLDNVLGDVRDETGTLGKLVKDDKLYRSLTTDIAGAASLLRSLLEELKTGEGLLSKMMRKEASKPLHDDLASAIHNFSEAAIKLNHVAEKIDSGQGTLGKMINDPSFYDDLVDIMRGAKKSWFLKRWLASIKKKGEKEREGKVEEEE